MYCMECGAELPENAEFCPFCGTKVKYRTNPHTTAHEAPEISHQAYKKVSPEHRGAAPQNTFPGSGSSASHDAPPEFSNPSPQKGASSSLLPIIAALAAVLVLLTGLVTFFLIKQKARTESDKTPRTENGSNTIAQNSNNSKAEDESEFFLVEKWEFQPDSSYASSVLEYEYDDEWHLISVTDNGAPKNKYEYDSFGNCVAEYSYKNGVLVEGMKYEYDETGTYNTRIDFVNSNDELVGYAENEYDEQGRIIRYSGYRLDGRLGEYHEYNYNSDGSYSKVEHLNLLVSEKTISHLYNTDGNEYQCETTYANYDQRELEEKEWSDEGKVLSIIDTRYSGGSAYYEETRTNEFNDDGYFCHAEITVRELNGEGNGYDESYYNIYQEYDMYGNKIHNLNEQNDREYYYVYVNKAGRRFGDDFDHRGVSE